MAIVITCDLVPENFPKDNKDKDDDLVLSTSDYLITAESTEENLCADLKLNNEENPHPSTESPNLSF